MLLTFLAAAPPDLHDAERLCLLHLAEDGSQDLVQLLPELRPGPGDQRGDEAAHEGGGELGGPRVQQLVDHLHDVPEAAVALLVPPLGNLLQGHRHVGPQALAPVLGRRRGSSRISDKICKIGSCISVLVRWNKLNDGSWACFCDIEDVSSLIKQALSSVAQFQDHLDDYETITDKF